jgi:exodeoxyribonuclease III
MKLISWNVNGLRACLGKGFGDFFIGVCADVFCVQETKMQQDQMTIHFDGYHEYWNSALKKGYSGTLVYTKAEPLSAAYDIGFEQHTGEGRAITLEFERFWLVNCYTPNAQEGLARIAYRMQWEDDFRAYLKRLDGKKPVILCGDLNVAHNEIDIKNAKSNAGNAGFSNEERGKMTELLASGFTDSFRFLYPETKGAYTWWSYMFNARANNTGWRIDYFIVSDRLKGEIKESSMHPEVMGSDHCPVELQIS